MKNLLIILCIYLCNSVTALSQDAATTTDSTAVVTVVYPERLGGVNDFENVFTEAQITELENILNDYKSRTGNEIVIASISSIQPFTKFDEYAKELSGFWKVGNAGKNAGITFFFSQNLRQVRISTADGTGKFISEKQCKKLIDDVVKPHFKSGDFYEGTKQGVLELIKLLDHKK